MGLEFDRQNAKVAEVVCVLFPHLSQCLVYDSRFKENDPPRMEVSPLLGAADRRLRHVNRQRPHLKHTRDLAIVSWTGSVESLASSDLWGMLVARMVDSGFENAIGSCHEAMEKLRKWERRALIEMIRDKGPYHTIWSRTGV